MGRELSIGPLIQKGTAMASIVFDRLTLEVSEEVEEVLSRVVNSKDGLRNGNGAILAPAGWMILTDADTGGDLYVQVARLDCVHGG
jgi:hypothetical protein